MLLIADRSSSIKLQLRDLGSERSWASNSTCRVRTAGARGRRRFDRDRLEHADAPHALALLRARRARPRRCRITEQRYELATPS
jgi:hypothetical protein